MSAIKKLLNPVLESGVSDSDFEPSGKASLRDTNIYIESQLRKRIKLCKDAAIFTRGPIQGKCRYPPRETQDELLLSKHKELQIYPLGNIADFPRHIPYSSEKKSFLQKTGRDSLEVFQYQFKLPGDETIYSMLWDYNIGLVRTTPLFKCTGHSKTTPAKMLNRNPGLREICHSITGGALVAQGYWMPFEAAKAVAATFCWQIRYALTPVFGEDFAGLCLPPDHSRYGDMTIDQAITRRCTDEAINYRDAEVHTTSRETTSTPTPSPITSETAAFPAFTNLITHDLHLPESNYCSDISDGDSESPKVSEPRYRKPPNFLNVPRSVPNQSVSQPTQPPNRGIKRPLQISGTSSPNPSSDVDEGYDGDSSSMEIESRNVHYHTPGELEVAYILASLKYTVAQENRSGRRRASA